MKNGLSSLLAVLVGISVLGCGSKGHDDHEGHDHDEGHSAKAQHGGVVVEVGEEVAHVEVVHKAKEGRVVLYLTGKDGTTALDVADPPTLSIRTQGVAKDLVTVPTRAREGEASEFSVSDDALKDEPLEGRLVLKLEGKSYRCVLKNEHK